MEPGHHLREQQLADLVGVSRTPIRSALDLLAERGIVETRKNQGYFLRKPFDTLHRIEIEIPSTADERTLPEAGSRPPRQRHSEFHDPERDRAPLRRRPGRADAHAVAARRGRTDREEQGPRLDLSSDVRFAGLAQRQLRIPPHARTRLLPAADIQAGSRRNRADAACSICISSRIPTSPPSAARSCSKPMRRFTKCAPKFCGNAFFVQAIQHQNRLRRLLEFGSYFNSRRVQDWCREHSRSSRRSLPVTLRRPPSVCAPTSNRRWLPLKSQRNRRTRLREIRHIERCKMPARTRHGLAGPSYRGLQWSEGASPAQGPPHGSSVDAHFLS